MMMLVQLAVLAASTVAMYLIVSRHNARMAETATDPDLAAVSSLSPAVVAGGTAFFAAIVVPWAFYRMHGPIGILYGIGFVAGMMVTTLAGAVALALVRSAM